MKLLPSFVLFLNSFFQSFKKKRPKSSWQHLNFSVMFTTENEIIRRSWRQIYRLWMTYVFWPFLTYLPSPDDFYPITSDIWELLWTPLPTIKSDVIYGGSLKVGKFQKQIVSTSDHPNKQHNFLTLISTLARPLHQDVEPCRVCEKRNV